MKPIVSVLIFVLLLTVSCDKTSTNPNNIEKLNLPLSAGTFWKYTQVFSILPQSVLAESERIIIGPATLINGKSVTKAKSKNKPANRDTIIVDEYLSLSPDSYIEYSDSADTIGVKILDFPLEPGKQWISKDDTFKVESLDNTVEVEFGKYENCILITRKSGPSSYSTLSRYFWKDEIGLIKLETDFLFRSPTLTQTMQLYSHMAQ